MKQLFFLCLIALTLLAGCGEDVALAVGAEDRHDRYRISTYDCVSKIGDTVNIYEGRCKKDEGLVTVYESCWTMFQPAGISRYKVVILTDLPGCDSDTLEEDDTPSRNRIHYKNEVRTDESRQSTEISVEVK